MKHGSLSSSPILLVAGALLGAAACDGSSGTVSCRESVSMGQQVSVVACVEMAGMTPDQEQLLRDQCSPSSTSTMSVQATFVEEPCPRADIIGGCRMPSGSIEMTVWYYKGESLTPKTVEDMCRSMGCPFVSAQ
jgi:hypothetical protein